ncbi:MAG TPA: PilZ domain-containing protein [Terracidiphilus sp.]|nr:PilZ domain-containing protein [Terracidiphilus sp.]
MSAQPFPERRAAPRYPLRLPVIFYWNDGSDHAGGGFTIDIAVDGALISSSSCPPVGTEVQVEVLIPSPRFALEEIRIQSKGVVTRIWKELGAGYFGLRGEFNDDQLTQHVIR